MREKPILFSTPMVRALLDGRKTQTRRVIKPQPVLKSGFWELGGAGWSENIKQVTPVPCHSLYGRMPYKPGDILWVRETWNKLTEDARDVNGDTTYIYKASWSDGKNWKWRASILMPRDAARLFLEVKSVRAERMQDISEEDAKAEGIASDGDEAAVISFSRIWDTLNAKRGCPWESNPWVWVIEFVRIEYDKKSLAI